MQSSLTRHLNNGLVPAVFKIIWCFFKPYFDRFYYLFIFNLRIVTIWRPPLLATGGLVVHWVSHAIVQSIGSNDCLFLTNWPINCRVCLISCPILTCILTTRRIDFSIKFFTVVCTWVHSCRYSCTIVQLMMHAQQLIGQSVKINDRFTYLNKWTEHTV